MIRSTALTVAVICTTLSSCAPAQPPFDLVVANGRVMDPESGVDGVRHIGIRGAKLEAISETPLAGARVIDASRHVVSPGFIDLHEHGQQEESYRMMVRDGVTSAFELEVGTSDVAAWYAARDGGQIVNYGVSVGHIPVRMKVLGDPGTGLLPAGIGGSGTASEAQLKAMEALFRVAGAARVSVHIHMRGGLQGLKETIAAAAAAHAPLHIVHVNSSADDELDAFLAAIQAARDAGHDVTTEAYPYGAGMTEFQSALFDDWARWRGGRVG